MIATERLQKGINPSILLVLVIEFTISLDPQRKSNRRLDAATGYGQKYDVVFISSMKSAADQRR